MNTRRMLLCLLLPLILIFLTIGNVKARTAVFTLQPKQEVPISSPKLTSSETIIGNISVQGGVVDFYVSNPTGKIVFCYNQTANTNFDFTASETGNYTFHFVNSLSAENVTVVLNYGVNFIHTSKVDLNVAHSLGVATVSSPLPPEPPDDLPGLENLYERYLNFRGAEKILKIVRDIRMYMPLRSIIGIVGLTFLLVPLCCGIASRSIKN